MIVYVAGYPKSGTTWITRLLGDALNCKTGGSLPLADGHEMATEGRNRPGDMVIRKGHFILHDGECDKVVPYEHQMYWQLLNSDQHKVVFVVRDPRDIAVSGAFYWKMSVHRFFAHMIAGTGPMRAIGPWGKYVASWIEHKDRINYVTAKYDQMLGGPAYLHHIIDNLGFDIPFEQIFEAYKRQEFDVKVKDIIRNGRLYNQGIAPNLHLLRKGISGDWRNHFDSKDLKLVENSYGGLLDLLDYQI